MLRKSALQTDKNSVNAISLCYRAKIYRFNANVYWINILEFFNGEGRFSPDYKHQIRSRKSTVNFTCLLVIFVSLVL